MEQSIANSMLFPIEQTLDVEGLFNGKLVHLSFDCPENLREALNAETKANGTSTCKVLQHLGAIYVVNSRMQKHAYGNTLSKVLDGKLSIGEMNFTQYVQTRRRRKIKKTVEIEETDETVLACCFNGCGEPAVVDAAYLGVSKRLCDKHAKLLCNSRSADWRFY